jgi:DNA-binding NarL/FixJ family response regulator
VAGEGTVRVVVVHDHDLVRKGLLKLLEGEANMEVVGQARNGASARSEVRRTQPDVVLLEVPTAPFADPLPADHYAGVAFPRDRWIDLFTDGARRVVVLAQEEARLLNHN